MDPDPVRRPAHRPDRQVAVDVLAGLWITTYISLLAIKASVKVGCTVHICPSVTIFCRVGTVAIMKRTLSCASFGRGLWVRESTSTSVRRVFDFEIAIINIVHIIKSSQSLQEKKQRTKSRTGIQISSRSSSVQTLQSAVSESVVPSAQSMKGRFLSVAACAAISYWMRELGIVI